MTQLIIMIFVNTLAFWQKDMILFVISGIITILVGVEWIDNYPGVSITIWGLGVYQLCKAGILALEAGGVSRGWSQFRNIYNKARGR